MSERAVVTRTAPNRLNVLTRGRQGPTGAAGAGGAAQLAGIGYRFDNDTDTSTAPASGDIKFNAAANNAVTTVAINLTDRLNRSQAGFINLFDDSTSTLKGTLTLQSATAGDDSQAIFNITALAGGDATTWVSFTVVWASGSTAFADNENLIVAFSRTGDKGEQGAAGQNGRDGSTASLAIPLRATSVMSFAAITAPIADGDITFADQAPPLNLSESGFLAVSNTDRDGNATVQQRLVSILTAQANPSTPRATFELRDADNPDRLITGNITGVLTTLPGKTGMGINSVVASATAIADNANVELLIHSFGSAGAEGEDGDDGEDGTTPNSDTWQTPGSLASNGFTGATTGNFSFTALSDFSLANSQIFLNRTSHRGVNVGALLDDWISGTTDGDKGVLTIQWDGGVRTRLRITGRSSTSTSSVEVWDYTFLDGPTARPRSGQFTTIYNISFSKTGDMGGNGNNGAAGLSAGLRYIFNTTTTAATTGISSLGHLAINHANPAMATRLAISNYDEDVRDDTAYINSWDDSTSDHKGVLKVTRSGGDDDFVLFNILSRTATASISEFEVTYLAGGWNPALVNNDVIRVEFFRTGDKGQDGNDGRDGTGSGGGGALEPRYFATISLRDALSNPPDGLICIVGDAGSGTPGHFFYQNGAWHEGSVGLQGIPGATLGLPYVLNGNRTVPGSGSIKGQVFVSHDSGSAVSAIWLANLDNQGTTGEDRRDFITSLFSSTSETKGDIVLENRHPSTGALLGSLKMAVGAVASTTRRVALTRATGTTNSITGAGVGGSGSTIYVFFIPRGDAGSQGGQGAKGDKGDKGDQGDTGQTGAAGNSAGNEYRFDTKTGGGANSQRFFFEGSTNVRVATHFKLGDTSNDNENLQAFWNAFGAVDNPTKGRVRFESTTGDGWVETDVTAFRRGGSTWVEFTMANTISSAETPFTANEVISIIVNRYGNTGPRGQQGPATPLGTTALTGYGGVISTTGDASNIHTTGVGADIFAQRGNIGANRGAGVAPNATEGNIAADGYIQPGRLTTQQRSLAASGTQQNGRFWYNETIHIWEGYANGVFTQLGGGIPYPTGSVQNSRLFGTDASGNTVYIDPTSLPTTDTGFTSVRVIEETASGVGSIAAAADTTNARELVIRHSAPVLPDVSNFRAINVNTYTGTDNVIREVGGRLQIAQLFPGGTVGQILEIASKSGVQNTYRFVDKPLPLPPITASDVGKIVSVVEQGGTRAYGLIDAPTGGGGSSGSNVIIQPMNAPATDVFTNTRKTIRLPNGDNMSMYEWFSIDIRMALRTGSTTDDVHTFTADQINVFQQITSTRGTKVIPLAKSAGQGGLGLVIVGTEFSNTSTAFTIAVARIDTSTNQSQAFTIELVTGRKY